MDSISVIKLNSADSPTDNMVYPSERICQEKWYLQLVASSIYQIKTENIIWLIPVQNKFWTKIAIIPAFVQRIDPVFLDREVTLNNQILTDLIKLLPCGYISISKAIKHPPKEFVLTERNNYILSLAPDYHQLYNNYNNGHKLNIKHCYKESISILEYNDATKFAEFFSKFSHHSIPNKFKRKNVISKLIEECLKRNNGFILIAKNQSDETIAQAFFTKFKNKIVYLLSCSNEEGKKNYAMHSIIDHLIKTNSGQNLILDFEGSMIPGIAYFMSGFGALKESYFTYQWNRNIICELINVLKTIIKKIKR